MSRDRRRPIGLLIAGAALLVCVATALESAQPASVPEVLRARAIELVDAEGRVRAQLQVEDTGEVVFRLRDASGTIRVKLGAAEDGSGLLLLDERTEPGVQILAKESGTSLTLADGAERRQLTP